MRTRPPWRLACSLVASAIGLAVRLSPLEAADAVAWKALDALLDEAAAAVAAERYDVAEEHYRRAAEAAQSFGPRNLFLARALDGLGDVNRLTGRARDAEALYRRTAELWRHLLGEDQPRLATTLHHLGLVCAELGRREEADRHLREALHIWEGRFGVESPQAANTRRALARLDE